MGQFTIEQAARSLKSAIMLTLHGFDPASDFLQLVTLPRDSNGRIMFNYQGQNMPSIHGANGTTAWPGVIVEYGTIRSFVLGRFIMPVTISVVREIKSSTENEGLKLDAVAALIEPFIYESQTCPVYEFLPNDDYAVNVVGRLTWFFETYGREFPEVVTISEPTWLRREYSFDVYFASSSNAGIFIPPIPERSPMLTITFSDSPYTLVSTDMIILADASGGPITIQLPPASQGNPIGLVVKKIDSTLNTVTILPDGTETIDGENGLQIAEENSAATMVPDTEPPTFDQWLLI